MTHILRLIETSHILRDKLSRTAYSKQNIYKYFSRTYFKTTSNKNQVRTHPTNITGQKTKQFHQKQFYVRT